MTCETCGLLTTWFVTTDASGDVVAWCSQHASPKCIECGGTLKGYIWRGRKFCSHACNAKNGNKRKVFGFQYGNKIGAALFAGGGVDRMGYRTWQRDGKKEREHRFVAEKMIGRQLTTSENVHHWNEDKLDNRPENLAVFRHGVAHRRIHSFARRHHLPVIALRFEQPWLLINDPRL